MRIEIANKIADKFNAKVWAPKGEEGIIRVYFRRDFCQIEKDGVNIDSVNRNNFDDVKMFVAKLGVESYRR